MFERLRYDDSGAYEEASCFKTSGKGYTKDDLIKELKMRAKYEKERRELDVYFYRIGHTISYPLPLKGMPDYRDMPEGIPKLEYYPWSIWILWVLRERWQTLYYAWRRLDDKKAARLLQNELAALSEWDNYFDGPGDAGLCTGHLASCLAEFLANKNDWDMNLYDKAFTAANRMLDKNTAPYYAEVWADRREIKEEHLQNIPAIILISSAFLARRINHPLQKELDEKSEAVFKAWCESRISSFPYTEGTAYDGYLLDSVAEWIDSNPNKPKYIKEGKKAFKTVFDSWLYTTLPGRNDIQAPIGDVEPEMPFWENVLARMAVWYKNDEAFWLLSHIVPNRLTSFTINMLLEYLPSEYVSPEVKPMETVSAVCLRTGWENDDCIAAVAYGRTNTGHIHNDIGNVVIGRYGRFWITDPGYQQYILGAERDFSIGIGAHNIPVINGKTQSAKKAEIIKIVGNKNRQSVVIDITGCYTEIDGVDKITRTVELFGKNTVTIRDEFSFNKEMNADYRWLGGSYLAWAFKDGSARLSNEEYVLWISCGADKIKPLDLTRHSGSRGPLTLSHSFTVTREKPVIEWIFRFDKAGSWTLPDKE